MARWQGPKLISLGEASSGIFEFRWKVFECCVLRFYFSCGLTNLSLSLSGGVKIRFSLEALLPEADEIWVLGRELILCAVLPFELLPSQTTKGAEFYFLSSSYHR